MDRKRLVPCLAVLHFACTPGSVDSLGEDPGAETGEPDQEADAESAGEEGGESDGHDSAEGDEGGGEAGGGEGDETAAFRELAFEVGIEATHHADKHHFLTPGQAWADVDRDGHLDLYLTDQSGPNRAYLGGGDGQFTDAPWGSHVALEGSVSSGAVFADVDADGWPDLYVLAQGPNTLMRNLEGEGFEDVSQIAGVADPGLGETAAFADVNGDGHLDLYVANNDLAPPDRLYLNTGDGVFVDASHVLALDVRSRPAFSATFFDYDNDGDQDLYVANDKQFGNVLWRNEGEGCGGWCFTDVSAQTGAGVAMFSMGIALGDYDNDGDQDLFVSNTGPMVLLQNQASQGVDGFVDVSAEAGALVDDAGWGDVGWGAQFLDYDNDAHLDLYVAIGKMDAGPSQPNCLLRNLGDGTFAPVPEAGGAADPRLSFGLALADYDADGRVDMLVGNSGDAYALYRNEHLGGHYLSIELRGPTGSDPVGSRVALLDDQGRTQTRALIAGSSLGAGSSTRLHFGLGEAMPVSATVHWADGSSETREVPARDMNWVVTPEG